MSRHRLALVLAAALLLAPLAAGTQSPPTPPPYHPGLGDLMLLTVQPRHLKIGLAGQHQNWAYAAFAVHELEQAFERIERQVPKWREFDIPSLIASTVKQPLDALEAAAKAKSAPQFDDAYRQLTAACNACHQSANLGMIVIQAPQSASPFANQDFRPQKP